jgi:hypothetical protein
MDSAVDVGGRKATGTNATDQVARLQNANKHKDSDEFIIFGVKLATLRGRMKKVEA